jgi:sigma-B regulation protein RsbU (phosphoserine phosphatase)
MTRGTSDSASNSIGMGLYIVREIARAHGGSVAVESTAGNGTTLTAVFPCHAVRGSAPSR